MGQILAAKISKKIGISEFICHAISHAELHTSVLLVSWLKTSVSLAEDSA